MAIPTHRRNTADADPDLVHDAVSALFEMVHRLRLHFAAVAAEHDLSPQQARALRHLDEPLPMHEIAEHLHCDASNVTGIVDRLEERGAVRREPDPEDRRRRNIVLTPEGQELRERFKAGLMHDHPGIVGLSRDELATLRDLLRKGLDHLPG